MDQPERKSLYGYHVPHLLGCCLAAGGVLVLVGIALLALATGSLGPRITGSAGVATGRGLADLSIQRMTFPARLLTARKVSQAERIG
jgi:hypothetical protein